MEAQLHYVDVSSLKQMAQRRVIVQLLIDSDVFALISRLQYNTHDIRQIEKAWHETIEPKIKDKVLALNLPKSLAKQMIEMASPIGMQIKRWKDRQDCHFRNEILETVWYLSKLCWTSAGLIDYWKTAKELVCTDAIDVVLRYKLACMYCLEDNIPLLWGELSEEKKAYFYGIVHDQKPSTLHLHFCWPHILKGELSNLDCVWKTCNERNLTSFHQWAFEESAHRGNKMATEYFYQKLTLRERVTSLTRTGLAVHRILSGCITSSEELAEVFFYLLSVMTPEQGMQILWSEQSNILVYFLRWPWPDLFLKNINLYWRFIPPIGYLGLEYEMRYALEQPDLHFREVFPEFFMLSPLNFKRHLIDRGFTSRFLSVFFESEDSECLEAIFRNLSATDTESLVFQPRILKLFFDSILGDRWHMVQLCLREAKLSARDKKRLKDAFTEVLASRGNEESVNRKFERYFKLLDYTTVHAYKGEKTKKC